MTDHTDLNRAGREALEGTTEGSWRNADTCVHIGIAGARDIDGKAAWGGFDLRNAPNAEANARFIAWARAGVPKMVEAIEALTARLEATDAARDVLAERARQVNAKGWTPEHDDEHTDGEIARAAGAYALASTFYHTDPYAAVLTVWPWSRAWLKPTNPRRDLVKAGALILAEIERLDRAALPAVTAPTPTPVDDSQTDGPVVKDTRAFDDMARVADEWMHKYEEARQERDDAMALANNTIRQLQAAKSELRNVEFGLADPIAVHLNMLRGTIAKPTVEQIVHLYGVDALCRALQPVILAEVGAEPAQPADPMAVPEVRALVSHEDARIPDHAAWAAMGRWREAYEALRKEVR